MLGANAQLTGFILVGTWQPAAKPYVCKWTYLFI